MAGMNALSDVARAWLAPGGLDTDPLKQFVVQTWAPIEVAGVDISFTNSSFFMLLAGACILGFLMLALSSRALVPGRTQSVAELSYGFIADMVRNSMGEAGMKFLPFVFTLFFFILMANLLGMIPGFFTVTSHIIVNFAMALFVIGMVIVVGLIKHGPRFISLFFPPGLPFALYFFMPIIELISFLSRPVSLSVRLFANMLAGHMLLKIFAGFIVSLAGAGVAFLPMAIIPFFATFAVTGLEFLVAFLQAYVFAILTCIYLNEALHLHGH